MRSSNKRFNLLSFMRPTAMRAGISTVTLRKSSRKGLSRMAHMNGGMAGIVP